MTRDVARRLLFLLLRASSASAALVIAGGCVASCYSGGGGGTDPPTNSFYFPVGLSVSSGGNVLYAVNSDFDLQWNGGTLQSYDLFKIRHDTAALIQTNLALEPTGVALDGGIPFVYAQSTKPAAACLGAHPPTNNPDGTRIALGEACAPPVDSSSYNRSSVIIGAFATDLQIQKFNQVVGHRLFTPVRGNATLTWADVGIDDPAKVPSEDAAFAVSGTAKLADGPNDVLQQSPSRSIAARPRTAPATATTGRATTPAPRATPAT